MKATPEVKPRSTHLTVHPPHNRGFTLIELLVVIAIIAQAACYNNIKQLTYGMILYLDTFEGVFPTCGSRNTYGFQVEDWIWWRTTTQAQYPVAKSPVVSLIGGASSNLFRCGLDKDDSVRVANYTDGVNNPYFYSYTMTSYNLNGSQSQGMTSIKNGATWYPFRQNKIRNPSNKIAIAEEQASTRPGELSDPTRNILNDGRWVPGSGGGGDVLTSRHSKKANVGFADGHAQPVTWQFGDNPNNSRPDL
jgi:prepilin-type N-terminal cleavage/methylation domain-containing protein/prepilin-type processing-associated H-X9-DG protein